jgi:hypothetical protein
MRWTSQPTRRADSSYCSSVTVPSSYAHASCSIPIERRFVRRSPACQATSDVLTSWTIRPCWETT